MSGNGTAPPDQIGAAIAAAEPKPEPVDMIVIQLTIAGSGRPAQVVVPKDLSDEEMLEIVGWFTTRLRVQLREQAKPSPLWTPPIPAGRV